MRGRGAARSCELEACSEEPTGGDRRAAASLGQLRIQAPDERRRGVERRFPVADEDEHAQPPSWSGSHAGSGRTARSWRPRRHRTCRSRSASAAEQCQVAASAAAVLEPCGAGPPHAAADPLVAGQQRRLEWPASSSGEAPRGARAPPRAPPPRPPAPRASRSRSASSGAASARGSVSRSLQRLEALEELELLVLEGAEPLGEVPTSRHGLELSGCAGGRVEAVPSTCALRSASLAHLVLEGLGATASGARSGSSRSSGSLELGEAL